ncbi:MAG: CRISPR-associated protein Cas4 [Verrucomicrobiae bacterium]|nr:CRISPR-associated protein Cas4 [Verrucomicrobiae bacterium]
MEMMALSLLNDFLYCPRRAGLKGIDGYRSANEHTVIGTLAHEHADLPGYEMVRGVKLLRGLPVWSERLGLSGKADIVERHPDGALCPVEYKKGKRRQFDNDDAQLCAQALCLEEMFKMRVERGAIFHATSKRRREVEFDVALRQLTEEAIGRMRQTIERGEISPAGFKPACKECSLYSICLPEVAVEPGAWQRKAQALFEV